MSFQFNTDNSLARPFQKKRKGFRGRPPPPKPTDYIGEKPEWEEFRQKGNKCLPTTSAAVPCKAPIQAGKTCKDKYNWSNEGYIESIVECIKVKGGVKRREFRQECFYRDGEFQEMVKLVYHSTVWPTGFIQIQCWKHWSSTGCSIDSCQSDKMNNNGMGFAKG